MLADFDGTLAAGPLRSVETRFGLVSRDAYWATKTLILVLVPMGIFMSVLPETSQDRAMFVSVHQTIGIAVLVLVGARLPGSWSAGLPRWLHRSNLGNVALLSPPMPACMHRF